MPSDKDKGKGVDWEATAEMLSGTSYEHFSDDEQEVDIWTANEGIGASSKTSDDENSSEDLPPQGNSGILIDEDEEAEDARGSQLRISTSRSAPPPPFQAIAPKESKAKPAKGFLDSSYEIANVDNDAEMIDPTELEDLPKRWHTSTRPPLELMNVADPTSFGVLTSRAESKREYIAFERWECHECNLVHPLETDSDEWDTYDPNICKCCSHDRCGQCWDLDGNSLRSQFCDGGPLGQ